jgi:hypothetical protein
VIAEFYDQGPHWGPKPRGQLRPIGDSISWRTWRTAVGVSEIGPVDPGHHYPTQGCHGAPLERECPTCAHWRANSYAVACRHCNGSGRIRLDAPNRRDVP